jgi:peroxiredoxin
MFAFPLTNNDNSKFELQNYQGNNNLLLVFFRGAWCNYCKTQLTELQKRITDFDRLKVKIIALSSDSKLNSSLLKQFLKIDFAILSDKELKMIASFDLLTKFKGKKVAKPAVILFNALGEELYRQVGKNYSDRITADELITKIEAVL